MARVYAGGVATLDIDALIIGGGIAGLWTADALTRAGYACVVVERTALGDGQTIWSQGIIHSGLKYTLDGLLHPSARAIRDMPARWAAALRGEGEGPDLRGARVRSPHCWLWQTASLGSRVGMVGARAGLRVKPVVVGEGERPGPLRGCTGVVARLDEPVLDVASVLGALGAEHGDRIVRADLREGDLRGEGDRIVVRLSPSVEARASRVVIAAGNGAAALRAMLGLGSDAMQVRPLRMVMVRGAALAELHGHCVDGAKTRVTITSARDAAGRTVWQVGGEIAERGAAMSEAELLSAAHRELREVVPGVDLSECEMAAYEAPRAEGRMRSGARPVGPVVVTDGPVLTVWPTKLALAPVAADMVADAMRGVSPRGGRVVVHGCARPLVAAAPWDDPHRRWVSAADSMAGPGGS